MRGPFFWLVLLVSSACALSACEVRSEVDLVVADDGSGVVEVGIGFDEDALERVPAPETLLVTDDLGTAGWNVKPPTLEEDGLTWVRATKDFGTVSEAEVVLKEVAGDTTLLRDTRLRRDDGFTATTFRFDSTVDLSEGLSAFSDDELAATLDGEPLGESAEAIEERYGAPIEELFRFDLEVQLPGRGSERVTLRPGDPPQQVSFDGELVDRTPLAWSGLAAAALITAVTVVVVRLVRWKRHTP